jgi:phosphate/sulfate permease
LVETDQNNKDDTDKIDSLIHELNLQKFDYNRKELASIRSRAHQILAFCLVMSSIFVAIMSHNMFTKIFTSLMNHDMFKIFTSWILIVMLFFGFGLFIFTMIKSYLIMIRKYEDPLLDPKVTFESFSKGKYSDNMKLLREQTFKWHDIVDVRNLKIKQEMWYIYSLAPLSIIIIFIPLVAVIFL